jgi:hypothetical protein
MTNLIKIVCWEVWAFKASFTLPLFIEVSTKPGALKASFTLPLFIEVPVSNQESE